MASIGVLTIVRAPRLRCTGGAAAEAALVQPSLGAP
jgi:hypothetical protein